MMVAAGLTSRTVSERGRSKANAVSGATPSGATAITPPRARPWVASIAAAISGSWLSRAPPLAASPSRLTWTRQVSGTAAGTAGPSSAAADEADPVARVHDAGVPDDAVGLVGLQLADEVPPDGVRRRLGHGSRLRRRL